MHNKQAKNHVLLGLILSSMLISFVGVVYLAPYHFALPYFETDFVDYCVGIATFDDWSRVFPPKRSRWAGWLPWFFSQYFGILNGLLLASWLACWGTALGILYWLKESIQNDFSKGLLVLGILLGCAPWLGMGRMLNFYPEIVLNLVWGAALVNPVLTKDPSCKKELLYRYTLAGVGISLCLLADARGLIWAGFLMALVLSKLCGDAWKYRFWQGQLIKSAALTLPLGVAWWLGKWVYSTDSASLMRQLDTAPLLRALGESAPNRAMPTEFVWGHGNLLDLPSNILFILQQPSLPSNTLLSNDLQAFDLQAFWMASAMVIGGSIILVLWKSTQKWTLLPLLPFLLAFWEIGGSVEPHVRFYMQALPVFVIPITLVLMEGIPHWKYRLPFLFLPAWLALFLSPHWAIEREISNKMLQQAFPNEHLLPQVPTTFGETLHIQTLPITQRERQIAHDWDQVCTEALRQHSPWSWAD